jgi:hypothetical protein
VYIRLAIVVDGVKGTKGTKGTRIGSGLDESNTRNLQGFERVKRYPIPIFDCVKHLRYTACTE